MKKFSIVIPVYFNAESIPQLVLRFQKLEEKLQGYEFAFIFVDDGSKDDSVLSLKKEQEKDSRIKIIKLSKNYGSMIAIQAGLAYANGDCVGVISADLQDPPEILVDMVKIWETGKKVVLGVRESRHDPFFGKLFSYLYYRILDVWALPGYPKGGFDCMVFDRSVVEQVRHMKEKNTNIMNLIFWLGYDRAFIPYTRQKRMYGKSRWTFSKKWKLFFDSFIAFSYAPIRFMSFIGIFVAGISFSYGIIIVILALLHHVPIRGYAALATLISFFCGTIMVMLGMIGEYLWRILDEVRKRPLYIVDEVIQSDRSTD